MKKIVLIAQRGEKLFREAKKRKLDQTMRSIPSHREVNINI